VRGSVVSKCSKGHRRREGRCSSRCTKWYHVTEGPRTAGGGRRRVWSSSYPSRKAAEVALREELARRDQGVFLDGSRITVAAFVDRFLAHMATIREPKTVHRYGELLRGHVVPRLGGVQLQQLTPLAVQELYDRLAVDGRRDGKGALAPRTIGHVHRALHRALHQAVRWRLVARNVCADVDPPKVTDSRMVTLDQAEARQLRAAAEDAPSWLRMVVTLGLALGCRRGELLALCWSDVDLDAGTVRIGQSLVMVGNQPHLKQPKSKAGTRLLALPSFAVAALRRHRADQAELRLALGANYDSARDLVIAGPAGGPIRPDYCSAAFRTLVRRAGLPDTIHVHSLRHSAASFLAAEGVPASDIAAQLGHADRGVLALRVYVHPMPDSAAKVAAHLDRVIGGRP
jgi:integrase